jgi:hypothetical protein
MTPKITKRMADTAKKGGAKVTQARKVQRPGPAKSPISTEPSNTASLEASIAELRQALAAQEITHQQRLQELTGMVTALSTDKPMRLKPIRDMERNSPTYLLVTHYDFIPVKVTRVLN